MNIAEKVRKDKEKNPQNYCKHPRCLWRIRIGNERIFKNCAKHPHLNKAEDEPKTP